MIADLIANLFRLLRNLLTFLGRPPEYVVVDISGSYPERRAPRPRIQPFRGALPFLRPPPEESLEDLRGVLDRVARAPQVRGVVVRLGELPVGLATVQSLRDALLALRRRGKRVVAYLTTISTPQYYLAAAARLTREAVRAAVDRAPFSAAEALAMGLVDGVLFEDELPRRFGAPGHEAVLQPWTQARWRLPAPYRWPSLQDAVAVVTLRGTIVPGESREFPVQLPLFGRQTAGSSTLARAFRAAERAPRVHAVVFSVDSGGGSALASDLIWREVERVKRRKPVVAFMGDVAGS